MRGHRPILNRVLGLPARNNPPYPLPNIDCSQPGTTQHPRETQREAVEAIHDELQAYQHSGNPTHDQYCGGPGYPRDSAEEADQGEDGDDECNEWKAGRECEEEVGPVDIHRERLLPEVSFVYLHCWEGL